jgi:hypothetical protein
MTAASSGELNGTFDSRVSHSAFIHKKDALVGPYFMWEFQTTKKFCVERDNDRGDAHGERVHAHW